MFVLVAFSAFSHPLSNSAQLLLVFSMQLPGQKFSCKTKRSYIVKSAIVTFYDYVMLLQSALSEPKKTLYIVPCTVEYVKVGTLILLKFRIAS